MTPTTVAVIGAGRIGRMHAENLVHAVPGAYLKAVVSPRVDAAWADSLGVPIRTAELERVLSDPEIEAVVITAPSGRHVELIQRPPRRASTSSARSLSRSSRIGSSRPAPRQPPPA